MKFKELYEANNYDMYKPCSKHKFFDISCDDCIDANDIDLSNFDNDLDDGWDNDFCGFSNDEYSEDIMDEAIQKAFVVRDKQKVKKFKTNKDGFRVELDNGKPKEVKMMPIEKRKRELGQKRAQIKRDQTMGKSQKLRAKSLDKRDQLKLPNVPLKKDAIIPTAGV